MSTSALSSDEGESITRKEDAYRRLLGMVLGGEIAENEYLAEQRLAERFCMSRAPVREALQALCAERILENVPRVGYRVAPISLRETLDAIDVRLLLETESVRIACANREAFALKVVDALIEKEKVGRDGETDLHSWIAGGDAVHLGLASLSHNMVLEREIARMLDLLRRASIQFILSSRNVPTDFHYHLRILEAVREGNVDAATAAMREDVFLLHDLIVRRV